MWGSCEFEATLRRVMGRVGGCGDGNGVRGMMGVLD